VSDDVFDAGAQVGGFMQPGIGRELSKFGLANYAEVKTFTVKLKLK
jgi:acyl-CoA reductase-like NAD-dependent aldehyde dehydrogenase